ncbi:Hypothetical predicted protein [Scomber scombrus]|uniref:Uncharacterized protein n=1 Tax=Scomber scombrus TaxID=13677 RepID=A0AAV1MYX2_SCOSC
MVTQEKQLGGTRGVEMGVNTPDNICESIASIPDGSPADLRQCSNSDETLRGLARLHLSRASHGYPSPLISLLAS